MGLADTIISLLGGYTKSQLRMADQSLKQSMKQQHEIAETYAEQLRGQNIGFMKSISSLRARNTALSDRLRRIADIAHEDGQLGPAEHVGGPPVSAQTSFVLNDDDTLSDEDIMFFMKHELYLTRNTDWLNKYESEDWMLVGELPEESHFIVSSEAENPVITVERGVDGGVLRMNIMCDSPDDEDDSTLCCSMLLNTREDFLHALRLLGVTAQPKDGTNDNPPDKGTPASTGDDQGRT